jgi:hypothetical protein
VAPESVVGPQPSSCAEESIVHTQIQDTPQGPSNEAASEVVPNEQDPQSSGNEPSSQETAEEQPLNATQTSLSQDTPQGLTEFDSSQETPQGPVEPVSQVPESSSDGSSTQAEYQENTSLETPQGPAEPVSQVPESSSDVSCQPNDEPQSITPCRLDVPDAKTNVNSAIELGFVEL